MKPGFVLICLLFPLALATAGCAFIKPLPPVHGPEMKTPGQTQNLIDCISSQYPDRFNALHNVGLNIRGKTIILKGFLKVDRPKGEIRLVAQADMGGTLFEIHILKGRPDTISAKGFFKEAWLEKSVVKDLKHLYLVPSFNSPSAYTGNGQMILSDAKDDRSTSHIFKARDTGGLQNTEYRLLKKNRLEYAIAYGYDPGAVLPGSITIKDKKSNYTLNINVRYMIPRTQ